MSKSLAAAVAIIGVTPWPAAKPPAALPTAWLAQLLAGARAALDDSACDPRAFRGRTDLVAAEPAPLSPNAVPSPAMPPAGAGEHGCWAAEAAGVLGLREPAVTVQRLVAPAMEAVDRACESLRRAQCDLALVGELADPGSPGAPSTPMAVALKRLPDALAAGDRIRAVVLHPAVAGGGPAETIAVAPDAGLARLIEAVLAIGRQPRQPAGDRGVVASAPGLGPAGAPVVLAPPPALRPGVPGGQTGEPGEPAPPRERPPLAIAYRPPANPLQAAIAALWADLLGLDRVGLDDNFFELGGSSLLGIKIVGLLKDWLHQEVPTVSLYAGPTVSALAGVILRGGVRTRGGYGLVRERGERRRRNLERLAEAAEAGQPAGSDIDRNPVR